MRKADKKSRVYYRKLKLGDNIERFMEEKKRKLQALEDAKFGFRQPKVQEQF